MAVTAIICEYNPFHMGHKYQIDTIKKNKPDTNVISIMSPDFVQRGRPAVFDKYVRGECAVRCGADLAVAMPQVFALLSAEGFAEGGVRTAKLLGADSLAFGVEDNEADKLTKIAEILISRDFEEVLKKELTLSPQLPFPTVRQRVLRTFAGEDADLISTPNNILAVEYIKACLRYCPDIKLIPIKRVGNGYSDPSESGNYLSATAIRTIITENRPWTGHVPTETLPTVKAAVKTDYEKYDAFLFSALSVGDHDEILSASGNKELADTILSAIRSSGDYPLFRNKLSRKKFAETKIDRALISFLLGIKCDEYMHSIPKYVTLLAMNSSGREIIRNSRISVISKFGDAKKLFSKQIEKELLADRIWARCCEKPCGESYFVNKKPYVAEEIK